MQQEKNFFFFLWTFDRCLLASSRAWWPLAANFFFPLVKNCSFYGLTSSMWKASRALEKGPTVWVRKHHPDFYFIFFLGFCGPVRMWYVFGYFVFYWSTAWRHFPGMYWPGYHYGGQVQFIYCPYHRAFVPNVSLSVFFFQPHKLGMH